MTTRHYLSPLIGTGTAEDPYRPAIADVLTDWGGCDGRTDETLPDGLMLVTADTNDAEHAAVLALPAVVRVRDTADLDAPLLTLPSGERTRARQRFESHLAKPLPPPRQR